jgi:predicted nucleic acid-binding protein
VKILVDTNILVRLSEKNHSLQAVCKSAVSSLVANGDELVACAQVMIEFWTVATRPLNVNGLGMTPAHAEAAIHDAEAWLTFLPEPPDVAAKWRALANKHAVIGKQAHDTRLVALTQVHSLTTILTLNGPHFARFVEVTSLSPTDPSLAPKSS